MNTTKLPHHDEMCSDYLSIAIEGGINYWAKGRKFVRATEGQLEGCYLSCELHGDATGEGDAFPKGDPRNGWIPIDIAKIYATCARIIDPTLPKLCADHIIKDIRDNWFDAELCRGDAETADVVVQVALFGEVVYG
jgi:hypothetical protein